MMQLALNQSASNQSIQDLNQSIQAVFKSVSEFVSELIFTAVLKSVYELISKSVSKPAEQKEQLQLSASKQSLLITVESVILIQSCSSHHVCYSHRKFYF